jgi:signal peptidase II
MSETATGRPLWVPFVAIVAAILVADQVTKAWITTELSGGRSISFLGGALRLIYTENNGAVFGLFRGQVGLFALLSLGVIALLVGLHARSGRSPYMTLTLGLLLGGAVGNALDRIRLGYVVDFVDGGIGTLRFYTFNVGDACISLAIVLLVLLAIWPGLAGGQAARGNPDEGESPGPPAALPAAPPPQDRGPGNA